MMMKKKEDISILESFFLFLLLAYVKLWSLTFLRSTKDHPEVISSNRDYNNARMPIDIIQLLLLTYF